MRDRTLYSQTIREDRRYWHAKLDGTTPGAGVLPCSTRSGNRRRVARRAGFTVDSNVRVAFDKVTKGSPLLAFVIVTAAVKTLLFRYGAGGLIAVGSPTYDPERTATANAGEDGNAVVLVDAVEAGMPFREL